MSVFPLCVDLDDFELSLIKLLRSQPDGIGEYDLIQRLREQGLFNIDADDLLSSDSLVMFRIHFTVYHALYRLRDRLRKNNDQELELSPVCIRMREYVHDGPGLSELDPLYEYYMDVANLEGTDTEDVDEMLNRFWLRLDNSERRTEALRELELQDPVSNDDIRQQYRRLAMRHHPDRGGNKEKLQRINVAVNILLNSYQMKHA